MLAMGLASASMATTAIMGTNYVFAYQEDVSKHVSRQQTFEVVKVVKSPPTKKPGGDTPNPKPPKPGSGGGTTLSANEAFVQAMMSSNIDESKARVIAEFFATYENEFAPDFMAGVAGAIVCEGSPGKVESEYYKSAANGYSELHDCPVVGATIYARPVHLQDPNYCTEVHQFMVNTPKNRIRNRQDAETLRKYSDTAVLGVGSIQWTNGRCSKALDYYIQVDDYSDEGLRRADIQMLHNDITVTFSGLVQFCKDNNYWGVNTEESAGMLAEIFNAVAVEHSGDYAKALDHSLKYADVKHNAGVLVWKCYEATIGSS